MKPEYTKEYVLAQAGHFLPILALEYKGLATLHLGQINHLLNDDERFALHAGVHKSLEEELTVEEGDSLIDVFRAINAHPLIVGNIEYDNAFHLLRRNSSVPQAQRDAMNPYSRTSFEERIKDVPEEEVTALIESLSRGKRYFPKTEREQSQMIHDDGIDMIQVEDRLTPWFKDKGVTKREYLDRIVRTLSFYRNDTDWTSAEKDQTPPQLDLGL